MATTLQDFAIGGDPEEIRVSAGRWRLRAAACAALGADVESAATIGEFDADEAGTYRDRVLALHGDLDEAAAAWRAAASALGEYADVLQICQQRMASLRNDAAQSLARAAAQCADAAAEAAAVRSSIPDPTGSDLPGLSWQVERAAAVTAEHGMAVQECARRLTAAAAMLPQRVRTAGSLQPSTTPPPPMTGVRSSAVVDLAARLKVASTSSALVGRPSAFEQGVSAPVAAMPVGLRPADDGPSDFWSHIADLLGWVALALPFAGGGAAGGAVLAGGEIVGGGVLAAVATPVAAGVGVAAAILGGALLVTAAIKGESPGEVWDDLTTKEIAGTPKPDPAALKEIAAGNRADIPPDVLAEVDKAIGRAKVGTPQYEFHDGKNWDNWRHQLPPGPPGYYKEWAAAPSRSPRGSDRVIIAGDAAHPDAIYYWDHTAASPVYIGP